MNQNFGLTHICQNTKSSTNPMIIPNHLLTNSYLAINTILSIRTRSEYKNIIRYSSFLTDKKTFSILDINSINENHSSK